MWGQVLLAILLWPAFLALLIATSDRGTAPARYAAATLVLRRRGDLGAGR